MLNIYTKNINKTRALVQASKTSEASLSIIYRTANYTLDELNAAVDIVMEHIEDWNISGAGIDDFNNSIIISSTDFTDKIKSEIEQNIDKNMIIYDEVVSPPAPTYDVTCGQGFCNGCSMGGGVRFKDLNGNYVTGFISAGHGFSVGGNATIGGVKVGEVVASIWNKNGGTINADFALIKRTNSNYVITNKFRDGTNITGSTNRDSFYRGGWPAGTSMKKHGANTGTTTGTIKSTSYNCVYDLGNNVKLTVKNCYTANSKVNGGDSGGAIQVMQNNGGLGYSYFAGIVSGQYKTWYGELRTIYCDIDRIKAALSTAGIEGYYD